MSQTQTDPVKDDTSSAPDAAKESNPSGSESGKGKSHAEASDKSNPKRVVKKAAKKAVKKSVPKVARMDIHQAAAKALKDDAVVDVGHVFMMPISHITKYDNPRHEPEHLHEMGYTLFGDPKIKEPTDTEYVSLSHLAMSEDMEEVRKFVTLIEEHENRVMRLINPQGRVVFTGTEAGCKAKLKEQEVKTDWKIDNHPSAQQSIVALAEDIFLYTQLDPVEVRHNSTKTAMLDGGRRVAAILYLHAKSRVCRADKTEAEIFGKDVPKEYPPVVQATDLKATGDDYLLACLLNMSGKEFNPLQQGRVYHEMLSKINPKTGKKFVMKEAAAALGVEYGTFRNRESLWREPEYDEKNNRVKGITEDERRKVALGEMTVTDASRKALGERHFAQTRTPNTARNRGVPLSEMQKMFDETAERNTVRRQAIADCMGISLDKATKESDKRNAEVDRRSMQTQRPKRKKKAA